MPEVAEFKSSRSSNALVGLGLIALSGACLFFLFASEEDFLQTRARRGGILKIIEQTIGWEAFLVLITLFGAWLIVYAIVHLWKAVDATPDVLARMDRIEFHPAVRRHAVAYDEISHWRVEMVSGHPVLWLHFFDGYWSLQGLFKRKTVKLEGDKDQLTPLVNFFAGHPVMSQLFVR